MLYTLNVRLTANTPSEMENDAMIIGNAIHERNISSELVKMSFKVDGTFSYLKFSIKDDYALAMSTSTAKALESALNGFSYSLIIEEGSR